MNMTEQLRALPKVDEVLKYIVEAAIADGRPQGSPLRNAGATCSCDDDCRGGSCTRPHIPRAVLISGIREVLDNCRNEIKKSVDPKIGSTGFFAIDEIAQAVLALAHAKLAPSLRPVINATGIVLHTNLGRAPMPQSVAEHVKQVAMGYSTLEYNLQTAKRGSRTADIEILLTTLTGAEAACIVNNNAAAVLLALSALCSGGEVIVSRGELVEIGGSFRIPEVIAQGGAILREVGATNKTHIHDYKNAICENTAALLKVHTSNYKVLGFASEVDIAEIAKIAPEMNIPSIYDLGSGSFVSFAGEPTVQQAVASGVDILCFSGDKLLGGPQCGIVLGKKEYITKLQKHPLYRALRADKLTLAVLEATLILYQDMDNARTQIPTLNMLFATPEELKEKATRLLGLLDSQLGASIQPTSGLAGGGSLPLQAFESWAVAIKEDENFAVQELESHLRNWHIPIIARIYDNTLLLDVRTIDEQNFLEISKCFAQAHTNLN